MTRLQSSIVFELMDKYKLTVKDIKKHQRKHCKRTEKERNVCLFHQELKDKSILFHIEWQSETFQLPSSTIRNRIRYCQIYLN
jgi:penicillin-binding protein-related factor A (putative recombinase)